MKKFMLNIAGFFMIILVFNGMISLFAFQKYYKAYDIRPGREYSSFMMADSHGSPIGKFSEEFNIYNFSAGSDSYFDIKRKIKYLLENDYKIDTIYITVDDHTLSPYREQKNNVDRSVIYSTAAEYDSRLSYLKKRYFKYYLTLFQPGVRSLFGRYLTANLKQIITHKNGTRHIDIPWWELPEEEKIASAKKRKKGHFPSAKKSDKLEEALLEIIKLCQMNHIELIGIKFPLSGSYLKVLGDSNYGADNLFSSHGLKVIDAKSIFINNDNYFKNQDHLNSEGGKIFTKVLIGEEC